MWACAALILLATACSASGTDDSGAETASSVDAASTDESTDATSTSSGSAGETTTSGGTNGGGILRPAEIDPMSEYVFGLCRVDLTSFFDADDPLAAIAAEIEGLPAVTDDEHAEVEFLASSLAIAAEADNIVASPEMQQVVNLLQARCN